MKVLWEQTQAALRNNRLPKTTKSKFRSKLKMNL